VMSAVTVAHGALLELLWAEGTISFETTNPLAARPLPLRQISSSRSE
jgi:hypothetical protein